VPLQHVDSDADAYVPHNHNLHNHWSACIVTRSHACALLVDCAVWAQTSPHWQWQPARAFGRFLWAAGRPQRYEQYSPTLLVPKFCGGDCVVCAQVGTYQIALCAQALKTPFYVAVESYKFSRRFPLCQKDVPSEALVISEISPLLPKGCQQDPSTTTRPRRRYRC
jgi:hypothetical protein